MIPESTDFVRGNEYLLLPRDPQPWIVQDLIPIGGLVNIYAKPKIGKSFVALGMANAIADEKVDSYLGFPVKRHGRVAYLQLDTPRSFWGERIEKIVNIHNWNLHDVFIADRLMAPRGFDIVKDEPHKWLVAQMKRIKPICVIIDTLREAHCQDEDNATQMKAVVTSILDAIPDSAIVFVSHSRKSFQNIADDIMDDMRGSGYIAGRMDCIIKMSEKTLRCRSRAGDTQITIQQHPNSGIIIRRFSDTNILDFYDYCARIYPDFTQGELVEWVSKESGIGKDIILAKLSPKEDNSPKSENYTKALMMLEKNSGND